MKTLLIRNETEADHKAVERLTREAFWNVNVPGCEEHYLAHILRKHEDFVPELDFVAELDRKLIGNVMYTRARLVSGAMEDLDILTFGPVSILPEYQRQGWGKRLLEHSFQMAAKLGYPAIVIFGNPDNYIGRGFQSCRKYRVRTEEGGYPAAMLVKELTSGILAGRSWVYHESAAYRYDSGAAEAFDRQFEPKEKAWRPSQEMFYILSHSSISDESIE